MFGTSDFLFVHFDVLLSRHHGRVAWLHVLVTRPNWTLPGQTGVTSQSGFPFQNGVRGRVGLTPSAANCLLYCPSLEAFHGCHRTLHPPKVVATLCGGSFQRELRSNSPGQLEGRVSRLSRGSRHFASPAEFEELVHSREYILQATATKARTVPEQKKQQIFIQGSRPVRRATRWSSL